MTSTVNTRRTGLIAAVATLVIVVVIALVVSLGNRADATGGGSDEQCVPSPGSPAIPGTPAIPPVTQTIPAVPAVDEVWANFSPNHSKEPFVGPPTYPTDPRGTWHVHKKIPGGHEGPDGVYFKGNPHKGGDWFYRQNGKPAVPEQVIVITPGVPATPGTPAVPPVVCPEEPETPTETPSTPTDTPSTPTDTPSTPTETPSSTPPVPSETPTVTPPAPSETPTVTPPAPTPTEEETPAEETPEQNQPGTPQQQSNHPPKSTPNQQHQPFNQPVTQCIDGTFVTMINGEVVATSGSCDEDTAATATTDQPQEEGL